MALTGRLADSHQVDKSLEKSIAELNLTSRVEAMSSSMLELCISRGIKRTSHTTELVTVDQ